MNAIPCKGCEKPFIPKNKRSEYCSLQCYFQSKRVEKICKNCGKPFFVARAIQHKRKYCSKECRKVGTIDPGKRKVFTCKVCNKQFEGWTIYKNDYCSRRCGNIAKNKMAHGKHKKGDSYVERSCIICGKAFRKRKSSIGRTPHSGECCSRACANFSIARYTGDKHWNYKGGPTEDRGPHWNAISRRVRQRDHYTCQVCGKNGKKDNIKITVHHIIPHRQFGQDHERSSRFENLISLCISCHTKVEFGKLALPDLIIQAARLATSAQLADADAPL
jgi:hypothetical protein